jgi:trimeric autotransporter adhesin
VTFPHGLVDFTTTGCTPASAVTITVTYPAPLAAGTVYWKYGPRPGPLAAGWYILPATVGGHTVTFSITDGQLGDDDLLANGTIVDQGGPGTSPPVPALSPAATLALALLLVTLGIRRLAPRSRLSSV